MTKSIILAVVLVAVFVLIFLALRNFFAWYKKTNVLITQNQTIITQNAEANMQRTAQIEYQKQIIKLLEK